MKLLWSLAAIATLQVAPSQTIRVGTFHTPSIVVSYYRSRMWADVMKPKLAEMEQAKKAGDTKKVEQLDRWGKDHQELSHKQLTGEAPLTNILEALAPAFPEVARSARVVMIVADVPFAEQTVEKVDVTDLLLDWLKADEVTRKIVRELRNHKGPLPPLH